VERLARERYLTAQPTVSEDSDREAAKQRQLEEQQFVESIQHLTPLEKAEAWISQAAEEGYQEALD
jgi:hypothetical protein